MASDQSISHSDPVPHQSRIRRKWRFAVLIPLLVVVGLVVSTQWPDPVEKMLQRFEASGGIVRRNMKSPSVRWKGYLLYLLGSPRVRATEKFGDVTQLEEGEVSSADVPLLAKLEYLQFATFKKTPLSSELIRALQGNKKLSFLSLLNSNATDDLVSEFATGFASSELMGIDFRESKVTRKGIQSLASFRSLSKVWIESPHLDGKTLEDLARFPLSTVGLMRWNLTDQDLATVAKQWPRILHVNLSHTSVTAKGLQSLANLGELQGLELEGCTITDEMIDELRKFKQMNNLHLKGSSLSDAQLKRFFPGPPRLFNLDLSGTKITDEGLPVLAAFTELSGADLADTQITDLGLPHLLQMKRCSGVDVSGTRISDAGMSTIASRKYLLYLDVSRTSISDKGLEALNRLPGLLHLNLSSTKVTDNGLRKFLASPGGMGNLYLLRVQGLPVSKTTLTRYLHRHYRTFVVSDFGGL